MITWSSPFDGKLSARTDIKWIVRGSRLIIADVKPRLFFASPHTCCIVFRIVSSIIWHHREYKLGWWTNGQRRRRTDRWWIAFLRQQQQQRSSVGKPTGRKKSYEKVRFGLGARCFQFKSETKTDLSLRTSPHYIVYSVLSDSGRAD